MTTPNCYTRDQLREFLLGNLTAEICTEISDHVDACNSCEDTIVGLENTCDSLVDLLHDPELQAKNFNSVYENNPDYNRAFKKIVKGNAFQNDGSDKRSAPTWIGDYEIIATIAQGGMGSVFKARHSRLQKDVAIKILPDRKMQNPTAIARFSREMRIIGQMSHPSMVAATDAGAASGIHYLVMELVDGIDLGKVVRRCGRVPTANACELIRQSALGIQYAHEQGVIHRDVKPSNLMLAHDSIVKVLDLGLATLGGLTGSVDELTTVGQLMGTLDYMAPEQCGNSYEVDARSDIYGLGATLYKLLAGVAPYSSPENDTPLKKLKAMAVHAPTPITERIHKLPDDLITIIDCCLARDPSERFQTATELADALAPFCESHDLEALLERAQSIKPTLPSNETTGFLAAACETFSQTSIDAKKQGSKSREIESKPTIQRRAGRFLKFVALLAFAGMLAWAGVVVYLNINSGQLVIESEFDDVTVTVVKNQKKSTELEVEHGSNATRLTAGEYQVVINGESDALVIDKGQFVLKRGQTVVARITQSTKKLEGLANNPVQKVDAESDLAITKSRSFFEARLSVLLAHRSFYLQQQANDQALNKKALFSLEIIEQQIAATKARLQNANYRENNLEQSRFDLTTEYAGLHFFNQDKSRLQLVESQLAGIDELLSKRPGENMDSLGGGLAPKLPVNENSSATYDASPVVGIGVANTESTRPTYNGRTIDYFVLQSATANHVEEIQKYNEFIEILSKEMSSTECAELAISIMDRFTGEIAPGFQTKLAYGLAPLCKANDLFDIVFDLAIREGRKYQAADHINAKQFGPQLPIAPLESVNRERLTERLLELAKSENQQDHIPAVVWAHQTINGRNSDTFPTNDEWMNALIRILDDEEKQIAKLACQCLHLKFKDKPKVISAFKRILTTDEGSLGPIVIETLVTKLPNDDSVVAELMRLAESNLFKLEELVRMADERSEIGDARIADAIIAALLSKTWGIRYPAQAMERGGMSSAGGGSGIGMGDDSRRAGGGDGAADENNVITNRHMLINAIAYVTRKVDYVPQLRQQFELGFPDELSHKSRQELFSFTDFAISMQMKVKRGEIYRGYDLAHWLEQFANAATLAYKTRCLAAVNALKDSCKVPNEFVQIVTPGLRDISFENFDVNDPAIIQNIALQIFPPATRRTVRHSRGNALRDSNNNAKVTYTESPLTQALFENIDEFGEADGPFLLSVALQQRQLPKSEVFGQYLLGLTDSESTLTCRRAFVILTKLDHIHTQEVDKVLLKLIASPMLDDRAKLALLYHKSYQYSSTGVANEDVVKKLLTRLTTPSEINAIFDLMIENRYPIEMLENLIASWLAENRTFLTQSVEPLNLNAWGHSIPPATENLPRQKKKPLLHRIVEISEQGNHDGRYKAILKPRKGRDPEDEEIVQKAVSKLRAQYEISEGALRRKLKRYLERIQAL